MAQYIDKNALVAEIEKWMTLLTKEKNQEGASKIDKLSLGGRIAELQEVKVFLDALEVKEVDLNYNKKTAILLSSHQEVARLFVNSLDWVYGMAKTRAEDLLKVIDITGKWYWCDEIEFIENE